MSVNFSLEGRVAVVTGANKGIGQAIAKGLARAGADIVAVGRTTPEETQQAVQQAGRNCAFIDHDLGNPSVAGKVIESVVASQGRVDILVNNAGTIRRSPAVDFSEDDWDAVVDLNLKSLFFLCQAAARDMLRREGQEGYRGKIINIASLLSYQGGITVPAYTASKHGVAGVTKALANEWAGRGININAIAPGYIATDNTQALQDDPVRSKDILGRIPTGRWGKPEDLAGAAVFLASSASDYINGAMLPVDGGWLAR